MPLDYIEINRIMEGLVSVGGRLTHPMKAPSLKGDLDAIQWDRGRWLCSPKMDGNRLTVVGRQLLTSNGRAPANQLLRDYLSDVISFSLASGLVLDGELYDHEAEYHALTAGVINSLGDPIPPSMRFVIFDAVPINDWLEYTSDISFSQRWQDFSDRVFEVADQLCLHNTEVVEYSDIHSALEATAKFTEYLDKGYEGSMIRAADIWQVDRGLRGGFYKHNRTTAAEQNMFKLKPFATYDGVVTNVIPRQRLKPGALRLPHNPKSDYEDTEAIGAIEVSYADPTTNLECSARLAFAVGWSIPDREAMWHSFKCNPFNLVGRMVEFEVMDYGMKPGSIRHGRFVRMRPDLDSSDTANEFAEEPQ